MIYRRFESEIDLVREIYDSITDYFKSDHHFWLRYSSLEMEGKGSDLLLSENYIAQTESLFPNSSYVRTAKCNLLYRQARSADSYEKAPEYEQLADELAHTFILEIEEK